MSRPEKIAKRERAIAKLGNQLTVLRNTGTKKQQKTIEQMASLYTSLV